MLPRLLTDENFNRAVIDGNLQRDPAFDIASVQSMGLRSLPDEEVLEWAARQNRIILTHDVKTLVPLANARLASGVPMPGVIAIRSTLPVGQAIEEFFILCGSGKRRGLDE
jgi:predicted nuclease of predicted toxin-antitoxin system